MLPSILITLSLPLFIYARDLKWMFEQAEPFVHWGEMIQPCFDLLEDAAENYVVTLLVPTGDAVNAFKKTPEYAGMTKDAVCDLLNYHLLSGSYWTSDLVEAGPFLQTLRNGQALQVEKVSDESRGRGINFYSGLRRKSTIFLGVRSITSFVPYGPG